MNRVVRVVEAREGLEVERARAQIEERKATRTWLQGLVSDRVMTGLVAGVSGLLTGIGAMLASWWDRHFGHH